MAEIEFLVPGEEQTGLDEIVDTGADRAGRREQLRDAAAAVLWSAAAALAVLASFARVYSIGFGTGASGFRYASDGWGRYSGSAAESGQYGSRFGIVLTACAFVCAVLAVAAAARVAGRLPYRLAAMRTGTGIAVAGVLAGVVAAIVLNVSSTIDNVRTSLQRQVSIGDPIRADLHTSIGRCSYLGLAALVAALLALGTAVRRSPTAPPEAPTAA